MSSTNPRTVSNATTTSRHRSPLDDFRVLGFLVVAGLCQHSSTDSGSACARCSAGSHCASEMSTANCAPWNGRPAATSSLSSVAGTCTFTSWSFTLRMTVAPASRHTLAKVLSVGSARHFNLPDRGHAAPRLPKMSFWKPHSHLASVRSRGRRNRSDHECAETAGIAPETLTQ